jgi:hypothetical protein
MSIQLYRTGTEAATASNNLFKKDASFNNDIVWSSDSNTNIQNTIEKPYYGTRSCLIVFLTNLPSVFTHGSGALEVTIHETGYHIFRFSFAKDTYSNANIDLKIQVVVNGNAFPTTQMVCNLHNSSGFVDGEWNTYYQQLLLQEDDVIDFIFEAQSDTVAAKLYMDAFKIELNDRGTNIPTIYSETPDTVLEKYESFDLPNIVAGGFYELVVTIIGAKIFDYVEMTAPTSVHSTGLLIGQANVSAPNTVSVKIFNTTLADINAVSGYFNFKIVQ